MQVVFGSKYYNEEIFTLNKEESFHIVKVMRMREGERVFLTNGKGYFFESKIIQADSSHCTIRVISKISDKNKRNFRIHLAFAPTKNIDRIEWLLEKVTEIGVDEITPLLCEHSERKVINSQRLEKILVSAVKQSLKPYIPILNTLTRFETFIKNSQANYKLLAYCGEEEKRLIKDVCLPESSYLILIGPEGDFSDKEINLAKQYDFSFITLGSQRLRAETAGLYAICNLHYLNQ